jgi:hypothetical protein
MAPVSERARAARVKKRFSVKYPGFWRICRKTLYSRASTGFFDAHMLVGHGDMTDAEVQSQAVAACAVRCAQHKAFGIQLGSATRNLSPALSCKRFTNVIPIAAPGVHTPPRVVL